METLLQDLRHAVRTLTKNPGFTAVAVMTLALGIGANSAIFSVVNRVLLQPLDYPAAERIVRITTRWEEKSRESSRLSAPDFRDLRNQSTSFEALARYHGGEIPVRVGGSAEYAGAYLITPDFFSVFSLGPAFGRLFSGDAIGQAAAVVSHGFAQAHFGTPRQALSQTISLLDRPFTIVGVLPRATQFPEDARIWVPAAIQLASESRTASNYFVVGKLKEGIALQQARAELDAIADRLEQQYPKGNRDKSFHVTRLKDYLVRRSRTTLLLLMGAVSLVLLIACANVASLLLARATSRAPEMSIRAALGAGRARLVRQLLVESSVLALISGALGLLCAVPATGVLISSAPPGLLRLQEVTVDGWVVVFTLTVSVLAVLLFGLAPALQASTVNLHQALKQSGSRSLPGGRRPHGLRNALVVAEVALCYVLAIGAGLLFRSFIELNSVELGYRTQGRLVMYAAMPARGLEGHKKAARFFGDVLPELESIPGVDSAAAAMGLPMGRYSSHGAYAVEGRHDSSSGIDLPEAGFRLTGPGYFATMGIPLLRGRDFSGSDSYDSRFVAIVSQSLVEETFPHEDPLGKRLRCGLDNPDQPMTIVGVVGDVRQDSPASSPEPQIYMPYQQHPYYANELQMVLLTNVPPASVADEVRRAVQRMNPAVPMKFTTMEEMRAQSIASPRFRTILLIVFAGLAVALAMAGVYGVMSYLVNQRIPELGLRLAMGARRFDILRLILSHSLVLAALGVSIGLALSFAFHRVLAGLLYGVKPADPFTYAAGAALLGAAAFLAAYLPARRAAKVDPMTALRYE